MPKMSKDFPCNLNMGITLEMKRYLVAIGYFQAQKGEMAGPARNLIEKGWREFLGGLSPKDKAAFDDIMKRVDIIVTMDT